ncbi:uncharacterized protein LOC125316637 [Rhodamnia argentea]|uniref:Uncharacterized protein LOC125316637 n=1 Tax=Rhodamnia argentea TaxID=178133 RepID=A0ABM3HXV2_9MYRT|nr:uncharacterized protein LOC125316637 [Rhodamnia argentea]
MDSNMNMVEAESEAEAAAVSVAELIQSLEQATFMAKQLSSTADPAHLLHIHSSLHQSHLLLSSFLSSTHFLPHLLTPPPRPPAPPAENSFSSATGAAEPMQVGDDDGGEAEENSKATIDRVEERMRNCFIKNKRPKRPLSPSSAAAAEEGRAGGGDGFPGYDPHGTRLRALDLVYQFHG